MVLLQTKNSKTPSSPLNQPTIGEKPLVSFADLLKGAGSSKDAKVAQNTFVAPVGEHTTIKTEKVSSKTEILAALVKKEEKTASKSDVEFLELNPRVVATFSKEEIKELVHEAKNYLKSKIQESEGYKKAEIKELPTTLKGLVEVAKKFDIDIGKITFEEVRSNAKNMPQTVVPDDKKTEVQKELVLDRKEFKAEMPKAEISKELKAETQKAEIPKEAISEKKEFKTETAKELKVELPKTELSKELKAEVRTPKEIIPEKKEIVAEAQKELKSEISKLETPKEIVLERKEFKAETAKEPKVELPKTELSKELKKEVQKELILEKKELKPEMPKAETPKEPKVELPKTELSKELKTEAQKELKSEISKLETPKEIILERKELRTETPKEPKVELPKTELSKEPKTEMQKAEIPKEIVSEKKELKSEMPKTEVSKEFKAETQKVETPKEIVLEKQKEMTSRGETVFKEEYREKLGSERFMEMPKELKELPLFKTETVVQHTTTEQIMQAKAGNAVQKTEQKAPKERADETLSLLLRGEKLSGENVSLTADFSVATAKVIAPTLGNENKSLEQLLKGESFAPQQNENSSANIESIATHKTDSLEVKMNEAKQMIKYLSNDVKSAIDDYRSPFTRVKVQLNPQNLGEVDLTVVQRGKNLHVNISSNNTAIQTLSMNINELRVQLNNSGINNATFNFSSGSQSSDANTNANTGQQQRQNEQKAHQEYGYFENEETHEEVLSSLEIIVPRYI
ncbi:MAG: flagellar hook-length control protein FliK [Sulfurimonas sp.]|nr:flagellar hook-length control protein FliK [Sulfurimonas sp.]